MEFPLNFPYPEPPPFGDVLEIAPDLLWARLPLPFRLNHVNIYLLRDDDGWAAIDAGIATPDARAAWQALMAGPLKGARLTKVIVTHSHPDHVGLAGWLSREYGAEIITSQTTWLTCLYESLAPEAMGDKAYRQDYLRNGLAHEYVDVIVNMGHGYLRMVEPLPPTFRRVTAGDSLRIGAREFIVITGEGHAAEQIMLWCAKDKLFFSADQVIAKISPNVSVWATDPDGNPLGRFLNSLASIKQLLPSDCLVLPGHQLPFIGVDLRADALIAHHHERCERIIAAAKDRPVTVYDLLPVLFRMPLDPHETTFAFFEARAHVNYLIEKGDLTWEQGDDGVRRMRSSA